MTRVILIEVTKELFRNMGNDPNYTWVKDTSSKLEYVQLYRWYIWDKICTFIQVVLALRILKYDLNALKIFTNEDNILMPLIVIHKI